METVSQNGTSGNKPSSKFFCIYNSFLPINRDLLLRFHDPFILEKQKKWHMCVCVCVCVCVRAHNEYHLGASPQYSRQVHESWEYNHDDQVNNWQVYPNMNVCLTNQSREQYDNYSIGSLYNAQ
jgi:hypothetical protein